MHLREQYSYGLRSRGIKNVNFFSPFLLISLCRTGRYFSHQYFQCCAISSVSCYFNNANLLCISYFPARAFSISMAISGNSLARDQLILSEKDCHWFNLGFSPDVY